MVGTLWGPMPSLSNTNVQVLDPSYYPLESYLYNTRPDTLCDFTGRNYANTPGMMFNRTLTEDDVALMKSVADVDCTPLTDIVTNAATQAAHLAPSYGNGQAAPAITVAVVSAALLFFVYIKT